MQLPELTTLALREEQSVLYVTLNRPERKNALSARMIDELLFVFTSLIARAELRAIVLRGAGHSFCAGADLKDMQAPPPSDRVERKRTLARANRRIGDMLLSVQLAAPPVIAVVEGAVLGGGVGLVCVSDIAISARDARFGMPETALGLVPAQIAPFVVQRIGVTEARRLMLTSARVDAATARALGFVHDVFDSVGDLELGLTKLIGEVTRCAPGANARTKRLLFSTLGRELANTLDLAAQVFAEAAISDEAAEGTRAFLEKRPPKWNI